jgi:peptide/nickel transport system substrate-binding protein
VLRTRRSLIALITVFATALAACGSSGSKAGNSGKESTTTSAPAPTSGNGTLVLGAEQEMDCADWIASCGGSSWGVWVMMEHTMPRVFDYQKIDGEWKSVPSILLTGMPEVTQVNGKQTVTYHINPNAVWSDKEPITSEDFKYSWEQIAKGKDIYDKTGYDKIESVDSSDPKTAVVTFKEPYGAWPALFGGGLYGIMPSHILAGKSRSKMMTNGYDFSGGPWIAKWHRGVDVTLTPNPNWYGTPPKLSKVIFRFIPDTAAEFQAFKNGEVLAIYPQPQLDAVEAIKKGLPGAEKDINSDTGNLEALWMNNAKFPFDSLAVRQAFAYSIDRNATVSRLFGDLGVTQAMNSLNPPIQSAISDPTEFAKYTRNLDKVNELMTGDGWAKQGGVWTKNGKKASITINSTTENKRRELTEQIVQQQVADAGFQLKIKNQSAAQLFGKTLPAGKYQLGLYAQVRTDLDTGLCTIVCSGNIPSKANDNSGQNWQRINVPAIDPLLQTVDSSSDQSAREAAGKQADLLMGENMVSLPIDPLPNISLWSSRIQGVTGDNPIFAVFWNLDQWSLAS